MVSERSKRVDVPEQQKLKIIRKKERKEGRRRGGRKTERKERREEVLGERKKKRKEKCALTDNHADVDARHGHTRVVDLGVGLPRHVEDDEDEEKGGGKLAEEGIPARVHGRDVDGAQVAVRLRPGVRDDGAHKGGTVRLE